MAAPTKGSPVVDQLMAGIAGTEQRRDLGPEKVDILPDFYVELDERLDYIVRAAAFSPLTHSFEYDRLVDLSARDVRGYVRSTRLPDVGFPIGPGWQDHIAAARLAAPRRVTRSCDRCGEDRGGVLLTLALTPPHLVVVALDGACVDELDVRPYTFSPR